MLVTGTTGNDSLDGISTGLTFDGKGGVDYAHGLGGGDTFVFDPGYGQLEVDEYDSLPSPTNTLAFGAGVSPSDVQASVSGNNIVLTDGVAGDQVTLDMMSTASSSGFGVQEMTFANGTTWTGSQMLFLADNGTTGNDRIQGSAGNDLIDGRGGVDQVSGGGGDDTYLFRPGIRHAVDRQYLRQQHAGGSARLRQRYRGAEHLVDSEREQPDP